MSKVYLSAPCLNGKELALIKEALDSNWVSPLGPHVEAFEMELQEFTGAPYAITMNSGTSAIHIALILENVRPGDFVFCSSLTFIGSANPILYTGATPVFIDADPGTWNICPKALEKAFDWAKGQGKLPKAVIAVDLLGNPCDYNSILKICENYNVPLIEDSAESLGASYHSRMCGNFGKYGILSFNGNKIITSSGGGALLLHDQDLAKKAKFLITQARDPQAWYEHSEMGFNYRLSNICAAIGRAQLSDIVDRVKGRRTNFSLYQRKLNLNSNAYQVEETDAISNRWLSAALINQEMVIPLIQYLNSIEIEARHMWKPLHAQPLFKNSPFFAIDENRDISTEIFRKGICLPSAQSLSEEIIAKICDEVNRKIAH
jgi:pyridoxal phosphate-dependent aminotransferase EpsN